MTDAPEKQQAGVEGPTAAAESKDTTGGAPTSPARSDKSSDSEGKDVREKLKDTQLHTQATSDPVPSSDQPMNDTTNGATTSGDQSASGSDSERGRLRRKRSHEEYEDEAEADKQPEKKTERHVRKRSRDITKDLESGAFAKTAPATITSITEHDADEEMTSPNRNATTTDKASGTKTSPKNKRTRDQAEKDATEPSETAPTNGKPADKSGDERDTKRLRDKEGGEPATAAAESKTKIPPGSGFANTSAASPFAAMASKPQAPKTDKAEPLPQTSDDKFKSSGFGGFASSAASPFGGIAGSKSGSSSPFGAASSGKLSSFAGSAAPSTTTGGGFGALGSSAKSSFGGSSFGGSLGGGFGGSTGFGGFGGMKSGSSFASTPGNLEIKGLKQKDKPFGAAALGEPSDEEDGDEDDDENDTEKEERQSSVPLLSQQPPETGEEGETTIWTGRSKLYVMAGEGSSRGWKERGQGVFKFNITVDEPKKARFVLRADGTHKLLLNAAVTPSLVFGGDAQGEKPKDGRLLFNAPTPDGGIEMNLLKMKAENSVKLWEEVAKVQELEL